jgi:hypothetical protein
MDLPHRNEVKAEIDAAKFPAQNRGMAKKASGAIGGASSTSPQSEKPAEKLGRRGTPPSETRQKPSSLLDTRVVYCGDNLEQLAKLPDACVDLIYIDPPFNSKVFWGETKENRAFEDRHENTKAYIDCRKANRSGALDAASSSATCRPNGTTRQ